MIVVVDYGMGNLRSVSKAIEHLGAKVKVSSSSADIKGAEKLVLPGVGAFGDAVRELQFSHLFKHVKEYLSSGKPFLGICLGLQLLFKTSEESPDAEGLDAVKGTVRRFRSAEVKIPHMGWNQIKVRNEQPLLKGISSGEYFYFVHTFYGKPEDDSVIAGSCSYGDEDFLAVLARDNVFATQFHPEKSQKAGLKVLDNFLKL